MQSHSAQRKYPEELRERAVNMVLGDPCPGRERAWKLARVGQQLGEPPRVEPIGAVSGGLALAALARAVSISAALITSGALIALIGVLVARSRTDCATGPGSLV